MPALHQLPQAMHPCPCLPRKARPWQQRHSWSGLPRHCWPAAPSLQCRCASAGWGIKCEQEQPYLVCNRLLTSARRRIFYSQALPIRSNRVPRLGGTALHNPVGCTASSPCTRHPPPQSCLLGSPAGRARWSAGQRAERAQLEQAARCAFSMSTALSACAPSPCSTACQGCSAASRPGPSR